MVKIITLEGSDYSGKSTTFMNLAKKYSKRNDVGFNEGPIYPNGLTARLLTIANQSDELEREFLYTMSFAFDAIESIRTYSDDNRLIFQDRYWPSVIAYGRFLNREKSIHNTGDFRPLFIQPSATIYFSCSLDEKMKRSEKRGRKSVLDRFLLGDNKEFIRLEEEIEISLYGLPNVFKIDTTNRSVQQVSSEIIKYLDSKGIFSFK
jgi:thymidylate kinase